LARVPGPVAIEREYEGDLPSLSGDVEQLRTVLVNLLVNALEAMQETPAGARCLRLAVRSEAAERAFAGRTWAVGPRSLDTTPRSAPTHALVITVDDNGPGVPSELRERIFYPFFTTKERGSGVGLAMAQKIVASHGGNLSVESPGRPGARFRVRLPLEEDPGDSEPNLLPGSRPGPLRAGSPR